MHEQPTEAKIRAAMQQLLSGPVPDNLKRDVKSLCVLAGVPRATFYRTYPHLKAEFDQQRTAAQQTGQQPDPRLARIERLKAELAALRERLNTRNAEIADLKQFQAKALSQIAAQHSEIATLRQRLDIGPRYRHSSFPSQGQANEHHLSPIWAFRPCQS